MFSKRARALFALFSLISLGACSLRIGEPQKVESDLEVSAGTKCLENVSVQLVQAFSGEADEARIASLWNCASNSLILFSQRAHGSTPGVYSPKELRNFLQRYFMQNGRFSDALLGQLMEIKRTLVGGTTDRITLEELYQFSNILLILRDQNIKLRPYLPLTAARYEQADAETLRAATQAFAAAASEFGKVLKGTGFEYPFSSLQSFLAELQQTSTSPEFSEVMRNVQRFLPAFEQLKFILISPNSNGIASREWEYLFVTCTRWYGLYLKLTHARFQNPSWLHGNGREELVEVAKDFFGLLELATNRQPDKQISFEALDRLVDATASSGSAVGGTEIDPKIIKAFLRPLVLKLLSGANLGEDGRSARGLTASHLRHGVQLIDDWSEGQNYLDQLFKKYDHRFYRTPVRPGGTLSGSTILDHSIEETLGLPREQISAAAWNSAVRLREIVQHQIPLFQGEEEEITLAGIHPEAEYSYHDLSQANLMNTVARILLSSYAGGLDRVNVGVTLGEFQAAYQDLRDLGIAFRVFDPENTKVATQRFMESNLFTFASDGDELLGEQEATQLFTYMVSAKHLSTRSQAKIISICNVLETKPAPVDFFGNETIEPTCFRREYFARVEEFWGHFPILRDYFRGLSEPGQLEFGRNLEEIARSTGFSDRRFGTSDIDSISGLLNYVETTFARFDRDGDKVLRENETMEGPGAAFPIFRGILKTASCKAGSCLESDRNLGLLFSYLLAHGTVPGSADFIWWNISHSFVNIDADRSRMVEILAELARSMKKGG